MLQNYLFTVGNYWEKITALLAEMANAFFWKEGALTHFVNNIVEPTI